MTVKITALAMLSYYIVFAAIVGIALWADRNKSKGRAPISGDILISLLAPLLPFVMIFAYLIMTPINTISKIVSWINKVKEEVSQGNK